MWSWWISERGSTLRRSVILQREVWERRRADVRGVIQTPPAAREFYSRKVEELGKSLLDLEKIVQGKQGNLSVVEDGEFTLIASWSWVRRKGIGFEVADWEVM